MKKRTIVIFSILVIVCISAILIQKAYSEELVDKKPFVKGVYYHAFIFEDVQYEVGMVLDEDMIIDIELVEQEVGQIVDDKATKKLIKDVIKTQPINGVDNKNSIGLQSMTIMSINNILDKATIKDIFIVQTPNEILKLDANTNETYEIDVELGKLMIQVENGEAFVIEADCPNHKCIETGKIDLDTPYPIICLPNRVTITSYKNYLLWEN